MHKKQSGKARKFYALQSKNNCIKTLSGVDLQMPPTRLVKGKIRITWKKLSVSKCSLLIKSRQVVPIMECLTESWIKQ